MFRIIRNRRKPILLLDIDGTIAPLGIVDKGTIIDIDGWARVNVPNELISWLKEIETKYDIVWSSTWSNHCETVGKQLGLSTFEYIDYSGCNNETEWLKLDGLKKFIQKNFLRNIVIIDDEIPHGVSFRDGVKIIVPDPLTGISKKRQEELLREDFFK